MLGRCRPAETTLSGTFVLKLDGASKGKSEWRIGCVGALLLGTGDLGRESAVEGVGLRVGVEGRVFVRVWMEFGPEPVVKDAGK